MNRAANFDKNMAMAVKPATEVIEKKKPLTKQMWEQKKLVETTMAPTSQKEGNPTHNSK